MQTRARTSRDERLALVGDQEESGLSAMAFCRARGLGYQNFLRWKKTLATDGHGKAAGKAPLFVELAVEPAGAGAVRTPSLAAELSLGGGIILKVYTPEGSRP